MSVSEIFLGLRDPKSLTRERALTTLRKALSSGDLSSKDVELEVLAVVSAESSSWEAKQGGLLAAAEVIQRWDNPCFRKEVLEHLPRLLVDTEYRVRQAVAAVLLETCKRDGLPIYDSVSQAVLQDICQNFRRCSQEDLLLSKGDAGSPPADMPTLVAPPKFLHDTEGWRSLETSMAALEAMMQGCGAAFSPRIDTELLELLSSCCTHTNRFVREHAFSALKNVFEVCTTETFLDTVAPSAVGLLQRGLRDDWSQVRYNASVAARAFMTKAGDDKERFFPQLLAPMCLNRHYVAEGVRSYAAESWRLLCGPQGGARLLMAHFDSVIEAYVAESQATNHAVREAACHCMSELISRIAGTAADDSPFRCHFTAPRCQLLLEALLEGFQDESWPVRECAGVALGHFVTAFPEECKSRREQLLELWFEEMADNIPPMRRSGAASMTVAIEVWPELWATAMARLEKTLPEVLLQTEKSELFVDETESGPFVVPKLKPMALNEKADAAFTDQAMFNMSAIAPKMTVKRKGRARRVAGDSCMSCEDAKPQQLWEASEGMVHLLTEMALLAARQKNQDRLDEVALRLPSLAQAFSCDHYRHHHHLKQQVLERLPALTSALGGERILPHLSLLLPTVKLCAAQTVHLALKQEADQVLSVWREHIKDTAVQATSVQA